MRKAILKLKLTRNLIYPWCNPASKGYITALLKDIFKESGKSVQGTVVFALKRRNYFKRANKDYGLKKLTRIL